MATIAGCRGGDVRGGFSGRHYPVVALCTLTLHLGMLDAVHGIPAELVVALTTVVSAGDVMG